MTLRNTAIAAYAFLDLTIVRREIKILVQCITSNFGAFPLSCLPMCSGIYPEIMPDAF